MRYKCISSRRGALLVAEAAIAPHANCRCIYARRQNDWCCNWKGV